MRTKNKKPAVMMILMYLIVTTGLWMFLIVYTNSRNKLTAEHIKPISVKVVGDTLDVSVCGASASRSISGLMPESKLYFALYLVTPEELRWLIGASVGIEHIYGSLSEIEII